MTAPSPPRTGFDPEAEQEVDFAKYVRLLALRWWLLAAGLVVGAVIGYAVSLGGTQVYKATATLYLGQPLTASGNSSLNTLNTNPAAVSQVIHSQQVDSFVARKCNAKSSQFRKGISTAAVSGSAAAKTAENPLVTVSVQARHAKVAQCAANGLAGEAVTRLSSFARGKIVSFRDEIATDTKYIASLQQAIASPSVSSTDKLILQTQLRSYQQDKSAATLLLLQATKVESPSVLTGAAAQKVTARSRRNTVLIAALIGLVLGAIAALLWDSVAPRLTARSA
ncbi:MAG TPA: Wzz/FepE/Etk N-terminal domain-containing protein [Gaiellaceae bacterium]|nr:Wzz/FepE/Etk N-terminal domain-containing protein [Gaiellaceae bacterium]